MLLNAHHSYKDCFAQRTGWLLQKPAHPVRHLWLVCAILHVVSGVRFILFWLFIFLVLHSFLVYIWCTYLHGGVLWFLSTCNGRLLQQGGP